jgi:TPR repeat protein
MELTITLLVFVCLLALILYLSRRAHLKDDAQIADNITRAAQNNDVYAQFKLANMYFEGKGVPQDDAEAAKWFREAAQQDHVEAQFILATMYEKGDGVPQDDSQAFEWFKKAASQGHTRSEIMLDSDKWSKFMNPRDVEEPRMTDQIDSHKQDIPPEQVKGYILKAGQGDVDAQYNLGIMYYHGEGVKKNMEEALLWFHRAAEQDDPDAQYNLGFMYGRGEGVAKDQERSMQWFMKAAELGHAGAKEILEKMMKKQ